MPGSALSFVTVFQAGQTSRFNSQAASLNLKEAVRGGGGGAGDGRVVRFKLF